MSISATTGKFAICLFESKTTSGIITPGPGLACATAGSAWHLIPALSIDLAPEQNTQVIPPEVGSQVMWSKGAFKTGIMGQGGATFNVRANSIGWLLKAYIGSASGFVITGGVSTASSDLYPYASASASSIAKSTFFEDPNAKNYIPWIALIKGVGTTWEEMYAGCRVDTLRIDVPSAGIVTAAFSFVAADVADPSGYGMSGYAVTATGMVADSSPFFETCIGSAFISTNVTAGNAGAGDLAVISRASLDFSNNLSRDERCVGSYFLQDIGVVSRTCRVTLDVNVKDRTWYNLIYQGGGATPANGARGWSPKVLTGSMRLVIQSSTPIATGVGGVDQPASFEVIIPQMDFMAFPVSLSGNDIVRATLTANVSIGSTAAIQPIIFNTYTATATNDAFVEVNRTVSKCYDGEVGKTLNADNLTYTNTTP